MGALDAGAIRGIDWALYFSSRLCAEGFQFVPTIARLDAIEESFAALGVHVLLRRGGTRASAPLMAFSSSSCLPGEGRFEAGTRESG